MWRYEADDPDALRTRRVHASAYASLTTNSSRIMTGYSDAPMEGMPHGFASHADVLAYLERYATRHDLHRHIQLRTEVLAVERVGRVWNVCVRDGHGALQRYVADAVLVCSGQFWKPREAGLPGADSFKGVRAHAHYYRSPALLHPEIGTQDVVILGAGNSAFDLALELASAAKSVTLCVRSGTITVDVAREGKPFDTRFFVRHLHQPSNRWARRALLWSHVQSTQAALEARGLVKPPQRFEHALFTLVKAPQEFLAHVDAGRIRLAPSIARLGEREVELVDGARVSCDVLLECTGYELQFPFLAANLTPGLAGGHLALYQHMVHPEYATLAFLGQIDSLGSVFVVGEMQARWMAHKLVSGMPCMEQRREAVLNDVERVERLKPRFPHFVDYVSYVDALAKDIGMARVSALTMTQTLGCLPDPNEYPALKQVLADGLVHPASYRLAGPNPWPRAASVLAKL